MSIQDFTEQQKRYLEGFAVGSGLTQTVPTFAATLALPAQPKPRDAGGGAEIPIGPDALQRAAQDRFIADGKKLCPEEQAKRKIFGLDFWDQMTAHAAEGKFPKGTDVLLFKFQGMFYVAPAQDSFMCRLRIPGGIMSSAQLRGVADLAENYGGKFADVTTRANLQIRQIGPKDTINVLEGLHDLGIINRGAGADNIRNVTASPTAGIDPHELIDTRPLARRMHHYILNHREMYGLPRKFNIAFDGGGSISALEDTNDIGFVAVRVEDGHGIPAGVYFRMQLGGITGHQDFARDSGVLLTPDECVSVAAAVVRVFIDHGDRTDRKKARMKYVLDRFGIEKYLEETEKHLPAKLRRFPLDKCQPRERGTDRLAHIGAHPQKQVGMSYVGVVLPVGRMSSAQMRGIASIADRFGSGTIRLTVWQNLLISDIPSKKVDEVKREIEALGLHHAATSFRAGLVACTGSAGCKYAAANTKKHAMEIAEHLESRLKLDVPINIHLTGCHHSCAQHYIGDIGLIATKVGEEAEEGYHVFIGGGYGPERGIGREMYRDVTATKAPGVIEGMVRGYLDNRQDDEECFRDFVRRHKTDELKALFERQVANL
jgi:ferredoxin-nitrite reductase